MDVRAHTDPTGYLDLVGPLLSADHVRHTVALTVLDGLVRAPHAGAEPALLLTLHEGAELVGAAVRTPPYGLISSAVPLPAAPSLVAALDELAPGLPGFTGPVEVVDALAAASGRRVVDRRDLQLFALEELRTPVGVPGAARAVAGADVDLVAARLLAFAAEARTHPPSDPAAVVRQWAVAGAHGVLWEVDGQAVALARSSPTVAGMSRVGPVHTPPGHRGHGYGAAATAAATRAALDAGARDVVLFTDLANPGANRLYPRVGFTPVERHREVQLGPRT